MYEEEPLSLLEKFKDIETRETLVNERILFILNREIGLAPYTHEFIPSRNDSQIMSGFISALSNYMDEMTGQQSSQWKTVYGPDSTMIVQHGEWATGVISVAHDTIEIRSKLKKVVTEFEETFQFLREGNELEGSLFGDFDNFVRRVFSFDRISGNTLIYKITDKPSAINIQLPSVKFKVTKFLENASDWQTVAEAAIAQGINNKEAIEIVSHAYWGGALSLLLVPNDNDILMPSNESLSFIFHPSNPTGVSEDTLRVVGNLDGRTPVARLTNLLQIKNHYTTLLELGYLLNKGLLRRISVEERFALIEECKASHIFQWLVKDSGIDEVAPLFRSIVQDGMHISPWISFLRLYADGKVRYHRIPDLIPDDINSITNAFNYMIEDLISGLKEIKGEEYANSLMKNAKDICQKRFQYLLENVIV